MRQVYALLRENTVVLTQMVVFNNNNTIKT